MSNTDTNNTRSGGGGNSLTAILTALQQGVTAINNLTQTMKTIFPSTS